MRRLFASTICVTLVAAAAAPVGAQNASDWITLPAAQRYDEAGEPVAIQFRRSLDLDTVPRALLVKVSADNRFVLYVNGARVAEGPSRGDLQHWRYETLDLAPFLRPGKNVIAAEVWSDGKVAPLAQLTGGRTAFLFKAANAAGQAILGDSTAKGWSVRIDGSRSVGSGMKQIFEQVGGGFYAAGGPETITASARQPDWDAPVSTASDWRPATVLDGRPHPLTLVADTLPQMKYEPVAPGKVVRAKGIDASTFPGHPLTVPAHSDVSILIDAGRVLAAYPALTTSGGKGSRIELTYTEALYGPERVKVVGNPGAQLVRFADRARVDDGLARGLTDTLLPDGGANERLHPFWWRGWRFLQLHVVTGDQPLTLDKLDVHETGYPFKQKGYFHSSDPELDKIWKVGWHTALFDAHETYMDTAYWEQLQYIGDTRIQMLLSYDVAGDDRLAIQALKAVDNSRVVEGLPQSAWPESNKNVIPPFALLWIGSLHDYWMRQPDTRVIRQTLDGTRYVLDWYSKNLAPSGIVQESSGWPFVDWVGPLSGWEYRGGKGPENCVITMMYYGALHQAADLEKAVGDPSRAPAYLAQARKLRDNLNARCWDADRGLYSDTPAKTEFSQHAAILAVLYDLVPRDKQAAMLDKVTVPGGGIAAPKGILGSTYYFSFYLAKALDHAGLTDRYIAMLKPWREMLAKHFTTFPETPDPSRSDSHAWSAHPTSGMLSYIAGIEPSAPGFASVRIAPHLGTLTKVDAGMAHPQGLIEAHYRRSGRQLAVQITLPGKLAGTFRWKGQTMPLKPGRNSFSVSAVDAR